MLDTISELIACGAVLVERSAEALRPQSRALAVGPLGPHGRLGRLQRLLPVLLHSIMQSFLFVACWKKVSFVNDQFFRL